MHNKSLKFLGHYIFVENMNPFFKDKINCVLQNNFNNYEHLMIISRR